MKVTSSDRLQYGLCTLSGLLEDRSDSRFRRRGNVRASGHVETPEPKARSIIYASLLSYLLCGALLVPALAGAQHPPKRRSPTHGVPATQALQSPGIDKEVLARLVCWETGPRGAAATMISTRGLRRRATPRRPPRRLINGARAMARQARPATSVGPSRGVNKDRELVFMMTSGERANRIHALRSPGRPKGSPGSRPRSLSHGRLRACGRARGEGDLTLYTIHTAMDDLDEVRAWLGYETPHVPAARMAPRAAQATCASTGARAQPGSFGVMIMTARCALQRPQRPKSRID